MHHHETLPAAWPMMRRAAVAASVLAALGLLAALGGTGRADAMPAVIVPAVIVPAAITPAESGPVIERVADGCGPGFFRTLAGQCFPNRRFVGPYGGVHAPPPCPPGYLRAPDRPLCYPVR